MIPETPCQNQWPHQMNWRGHFLSFLYNFYLIFLFFQTVDINPVRPINFWIIT